MGDENPIRTLGDYSRPSHEGYRNTIELPDGNNLVPLQSDIIWLVQNGCSFHGLWSKDPNQYLKDFLKLVDSLDLVEDVLVEIAGYIYLVDFVILDVKEDKKKPFILGTPFLTTAKAKIRFDKGTITLKFGKNKINFFKIPESLYKVEEGTESDIDLAAPTTTINRLILEWEERIKLHQEKEMEFNQ
ncbi:MAK10-like protein [Tanacetum coccineum]